MNENENKRGDYLVIDQDDDVALRLDNVTFEEAKEEVEEYVDNIDYEVRLYKLVGRCVYEAKVWK